MPLFAVEIAERETSRVSEVSSVSDACDTMFGQELHGRESRTRLQAGGVIDGKASVRPKLFNRITYPLMESFVTSGLVRVPVVGSSRLAGSEDVRK